MVSRRMLPDVERGEMKPDEIDEASNSSQAPVGDQAPPADSSERESMSRSSTSSCGSGVRTRPGGVSAAQKSLVHHREPLAVRLSRTQCSEASPDLREVFVVGGELRFKLRGDGSHRSRDAQLGGQCFDLRDQEAERSGPLEVEYLAAGGVGGDVRIAVTITTDPRSEAHRLRTRGQAEPISERAQGRADVVEEFGNPFLKHLAEEVEDRLRLVDRVGFSRRSSSVCQIMSRSSSIRRSMRLITVCSGSPIRRSISVAISASLSRMLRRDASVGWAVKTG